MVHVISSLQQSVHCSAAVDSAYDGRHTSCTTAASNAADGRRTVNATT